MSMKEELAVIISNSVHLGMAEVLNMIEIPPNPELGDYAFPCFQLAKSLRKAPDSIASDLVSRMEGSPIIEKVEALGGYLNFFMSRKCYAESVLKEIDSNENYGSSDMGLGKTILVEFSSPNIAKPFHIGHLCSTVIGNSLEKIYRHLGYHTVKINHLGDWGTQFGKLISAFTRWGDEDRLKTEPIRELLRIYIRFHEESEKDRDLENEARNYFKRLEENDPFTVGLWKRFTELSMIEFNKIYDMLGITFDSFNGESFYSDKMEEVVAILDRKGLLKESEEAKVVDLEEYNMPACLILKSDGASIYSTRDLAAAIYRNRTYDFDKCIYVVGTPQTLHFQQVFRVLQMAGFEWYRNCIHVGFGHVRFADRKMATRTGDVVFLEDVLKESVIKSMAKIEENNPYLAEKEEVAKKVGVGAIVYAFLKNSRERDIVFSWDEILNFDGDTAPYIQYTYARGKSILRKAGEVNFTIDYSLLGSNEEYSLVKLLEGFKAAVREAAQKNEPCIISRHIAELSRAYNKFYNMHPVLRADDNIKCARLSLTEAVCKTLKIGLYLLGIEVCEEM
ncbi:MAG TPA: arginine--tRNA ligase [Clostridia bacterium]|nr:arginine--tRNA ligase [Clostridia bacterium]